MNYIVVCSLHLHVDSKKGFVGHFPRKKLLYNIMESYMIIQVHRNKWRPEKYTRLHLDLLIKLD